MMTSCFTMKFVVKHCVNTIEELMQMFFHVAVGVKVNPKGRGESDIQKNKIRGTKVKLRYNILTQHQPNYGRVVVVL